MTVSLCVHGHFYQPPRDNPWLGSVPLQPSAHPFHDWNERITAECYRPNVGAQVLNASGEVCRIINNFEHISFDIGPTLLSWLQAHAQDVYQGILDADAAGVERWGHGPAMAQGFHHTILPLDNERDRQTQIHWALADFRHRFARDAEGFWMPECAVDTPTLEALADAGVAFTVMAPQQIESVDGGPLDCRHPYRIVLPSGRTIAAFIYDAPTSQAVAFEGLLHNGERLLAHLLRRSDGPGQLVHIATDGESYGHHHRRGEMALAWLIHRVDSMPEVQLLPYAAFLAAHPPQHEARIREGSSWSCPHGVQRWRANCGCGTIVDGGRWRAPLRASLTELANRIDQATERHEADLFTDVWAARNAYIAVVLDPAARERWLERWCTSTSPLDQDRALRVMHMQRLRMAAFTSCAWFFQDVARIEPLQNIASAYRAAEIADGLWPQGQFVEHFRHSLVTIHSTDPALGTALDLFESRVLPSRPALMDARPPG